MPEQKLLGIDQRPLHIFPGFALVGQGGFEVKILAVTGNGEGHHGAGHFPGNGAVELIRSGQDRAIQFADHVAFLQAGLCRRRVFSHALLVDLGASFSRNYFDPQERGRDVVAL